MPRVKQLDSSRKHKLKEVRVRVQRLEETTDPEVRAYSTRSKVRRKLFAGAGETRYEEEEEEEEGEKEEGEKEEDCAAAVCLRPTGSKVLWVQCDGRCNEWFHFICEGLQEKDVNDEDDYICNTCRNESSASDPPRSSACDRPSKSVELSMVNSSCKYKLNEVRVEVQRLEDSADLEVRAYFTRLKEARESADCNNDSNLVREDEESDESAEDEEMMQWALKTLQRTQYLSDSEIEDEEETDRSVVNTRSAKSKRKSRNRGSWKNVGSVLSQLASPGTQEVNTGHENKLKDVRIVLQRLEESTDPRVQAYFAWLKPSTTGNGAPCPLAVAASPPVAPSVITIEEEPPISQSAAHADMDASSEMFFGKSMGDGLASSHLKWVTLPVIQSKQFPRAGLCEPNAIKTKSDCNYSILGYKVPLLSGRFSLVTSEEVFNSPLSDYEEELMYSGDVSDDDWNTFLASVAPPRFRTTWKVQPSTPEEKIRFHSQERQRFSTPRSAFTYQLHGYESVVGPVKLSCFARRGPGSLTLVVANQEVLSALVCVRDAVARLPNGIGSFEDVRELLSDSQFLSKSLMQDTGLVSQVRRMLTFLTREDRPSLCFSAKRNKCVYLHRGKSKKELENLYQQHSNASEVSNTMGHQEPEGDCKAESLIICDGPLAHPVQGNAQSTLPSPGKQMHSSTSGPQWVDILPRHAAFPRKLQIAANSNGCAMVAMPVASRRESSVRTAVNGAVCSVSSSLRTAVASSMPSSSPTVPSSMATSANSGRLSSQLSMFRTCGGPPACHPQEHAQSALPSFGKRMHYSISGPQWVDVPRKLRIVANSNRSAGVEITATSGKESSQTAPANRVTSTVPSSLETSVTNRSPSLSSTVSSPVTTLLSSLLASFRTCDGPPARHPQASAEPILSSPEKRMHTSICGPQPNGAKKRRIGRKLVHVGNSDGSALRRSKRGKKSSRTTSANGVLTLASLSSKTALNSSSSLVNDRLLSSSSPSSSVTLSTTESIPLIPAPVATSYPVDPCALTIVDVFSLSAGQSAEDSTGDGTFKPRDLSGGDTVVPDTASSATPPLCADEPIGDSPEESVPACPVPVAVSPPVDLSAVTIEEEPPLFPSAAAPNTEVPMEESAFEPMDCRGGDSILLRTECSTTPPPTENDAFLQSAFAEPVEDSLGLTSLQTESIPLNGCIINPSGVVQRSQIPSMGFCELTTVKTGRDSNDCGVDQFSSALSEAVTKIPLSEIRGAELQRKVEALRMQEVKCPENVSENYSDDENENDLKDVSEDDRDEFVASGPLPHSSTTWRVRASTPEEKALNYAQERHRFNDRKLVFTYRLHGNGSVVGPVKPSSVAAGCPYSSILAITGAGVPSSLNLKSLYSEQLTSRASKARGSLKVRNLQALCTPITVDGPPVRPPLGIAPPTLIANSDGYVQVEVTQDGGKESTETDPERGVLTSSLVNDVLLPTPSSPSSSLSTTESAPLIPAPVAASYPIDPCALTIVDVFSLSAGQSAEDSTGDGTFKPRDSSGGDTVVPDTASSTTPPPHADMDAVDEPIEDHLEESASACPVTVTESSPVNSSAGTTIDDLAFSPSAAAQNTEHPLADSAFEHTECCAGDPVLRRSECSATPPLNNVSQSTLEEPIEDPLEGCAPLQAESVTLPTLAEYIITPSGVVRNNQMTGAEFSESSTINTESDCPIVDKVPLPTGQFPPCNVKEVVKIPLPGDSGTGLRRKVTILRMKKRTGSRDVDEDDWDTVLASVPPPRFPTTWKVQPSTPEEKALFHEQMGSAVSDSEHPPLAQSVSVEDNTPKGKVTGGVSTLYNVTKDNIRKDNANLSVACAAVGDSVTLSPSQPLMREGICVKCFTDFVNFEKCFKDPVTAKRGRRITKGCKGGKVGESSDASDEVTEEVVCSMCDTTPLGRMIVKLIVDQWVYECECCKRRFVDESKLSHHEKICTACQLDSPCLLCLGNYGTYNSLSRPLDFCMPLVCPACTLSYVCFFNIGVYTKYSQRKCINVHIKGFSCSKCCLQIKEKKLLNAHMKEHNNI